MPHIHCPFHRFRDCLGPPNLSSSIISTALSLVSSFVNVTNANGAPTVCLGLSQAAAQELGRGVKNDLSSQRCNTEHHPDPRRMRGPGRH